MDGNKIYRITEGGYTPKGRWDEYPHLMNFKQCANTIAKKIADMTDDEFAFMLRSGITIWGAALGVVDIKIGGRVTYDPDIEPQEGLYIANAVKRAVEERRARQ